MNQLLKIAEITIHEQPRKDFSRVDEIAASIEKVGLLQPVLVTKKESEVVLIDGEQRMRALKKLGRTEVAVFFCDVESETHLKEAQMMANLMRADLSIIERARGFAALLEGAPAKYNELVIANKFGIKEKEVKRLVAMIKKINPAVDADLGSGQFDQEEMDQIASMPQEYQPQIVKECLKSNMWNALNKATVKLQFDSVFKKEEARSAGKIHYESYGDFYTFDKEFGNRMNAEYEARQKAKSKAAAKVEKKETKDLTPAQVEKRREERAKQKAAAAQVLVDMKAKLPKFLSGKPSAAQLQKMRYEFVHNLATEDARILLRAFSVEFSSDITSESIKKLVVKHIIEPMTPNEASICRLHEWVELTRYAGMNTMASPDGFKAVLKKMK